MSQGKEKATDSVSVNFAQGSVTVALPDWNNILYHLDTCEDLIGCLRKLLIVQTSGQDPKSVLNGMSEELWNGLASLTLLARDIRRHDEGST